MGTDDGPSSNVLSMVDRTRPRGVEFAFPNFARIPPLRGEKIEQVIFVTGLVRKADHMRPQMEKLLQEEEAAPFLLAYDRSRFLMGLLAPRPRGMKERPFPLTWLLGESLTHIEIERESFGKLVPLIDHRYGYLARKV
jgi:hypothetical protein